MSPLAPCAAACIIALPAAAQFQITDTRPDLAARDTCIQQVDGTGAWTCYNDLIEQCDEDSVADACRTRESVMWQGLLVDEMSGGAGLAPRVARGQVRGTLNEVCGDLNGSARRSCEVSILTRSTADLRSRSLRAGAAQ